MAAGVGPLALGVLAGEPVALAKGDETDVAILSAALMLEHHAIALYEHGLERGLFPRGLRAYAVEFRGDHLGHRDTQVAILEERGARAPESLRYDFPDAQPGGRLRAPGPRDRGRGPARLHRASSARSAPTTTCCRRGSY